MTQVQDIRKLYFEEGKNIAQISQETGRDRKTVRMYLEKEDWNPSLATIFSNIRRSKALRDVRM